MALVTRIRGRRRAGRLSGSGAALEGAGWPTRKLRCPSRLGRRRYGAALGPNVAATAGPCRGWPPKEPALEGLAGCDASARRRDDSPPRSRPARFPLAPSPALSLPPPPSPSRPRIRGFAVAEPEPSSFSSSSAKRGGSADAEVPAPVLPGGGGGDGNGNGNGGRNRRRLPSAGAGRGLPFAGGRLRAAPKCRRRGEARGGGGGGSGAGAGGGAANRPGCRRCRSGAGGSRGRGLRGTRSRGRCLSEDGRAAVPPGPAKSPRSLLIN